MSPPHRGTEKVVDRDREKRPRNVEVRVNITKRILYEGTVEHKDHCERT